MTEAERLARLRGWRRKSVKRYRKTEKGKVYLQERNFIARFQRYGLTLDQYHALAERQDFLCACCGADPAIVVEERADGFHIDHDHETGRIRALLCYACNGGLGLFADSVERLEQAISYLKAHGRCR